MFASSIKILPEHLVNQISAGEVIERPSAVVKELIENALDAQAKNITITLHDGGKSIILINDDGIGMSKEDLQLCVKRHATSKLNDNNLYNIATMGFRGEAIPSIASVARLKIKSKKKDSQDGYEITVNAGIEQELKPTAIAKGTSVEVLDLFYAIPARLKFLRTAQTEVIQCYDIIKRLALAHPNVNFTIFNSSKKVLQFHNSALLEEDFLQQRIKQIVGNDFLNNALKVEFKASILDVYGYISIPTFNNSQANQQYFIVNNRPLKDKFLLSILRVAYNDVLAKKRYPLGILFLNIPPSEIDVNVNPAKTEVRFKDVQFVRHLLLSEFKKVLAAIENQKTFVNLNTLKPKPEGSSLKNLMNTEDLSHSHPLEFKRKISESFYQDPFFDRQCFEQSHKINTLESQFLQEEKLMSNNKHSNKTDTNYDITESFTNEFVDKMCTTADVDQLSSEITQKVPPLGFAKGFYHKNWIIAENTEGLVLVDMHAAHERIRHETIKQDFINKQLATQVLLIPIIMELTLEKYLILVENRNKILPLGIEFDIFGKNTIIINSVLTLIPINKVKCLIYDIINDLLEIDNKTSIDMFFQKIIATIACHSSLRSGDIINTTEMNNLLRAIENTNNAAQCSHGRPTYVKITLKDIAKMFKR